MGCLFFHIPGGDYSNAGDAIVEAVVLVVAPVCGVDFCEIIEDNIIIPPLRGGGNIIPRAIIVDTASAVEKPNQ